MSEPAKKGPLLWVVDDSPTERAITVRSLGATYEFEEFSDGADVIERLNNVSRFPDVILLDWVMPGMTGDEVCRYVRAHPALADLAIVLFTASRVETGDIVHGLAAGANDYVAKPFAPEELRARVQAVLRSAQLREAASREHTRLAAINRLARALFGAGVDIERILRELVVSLQGVLADGCAILLLPGELPPVAVAVHRGDPSGARLASIATLADPAVHSFASTEDARAALPPLYHPYIDAYGMRGLAILPFPVRDPVQGVVTLTRDGGSQPFDADDLAAVQTCIEYTSLAIQNAMRYEAERTARARLTAVVDHAPIGILVTTADGAIELANAAAARMIEGVDTAGSVEAMFALGAWTTLEGDPVEGPASPPAPGASRQRHLVFTPRAGAKRVLSVTTVTRREVRELAGTVTAIEDVTAQHAIGAERERVAAFQEQMMGIVGHDLRNPLSAIVTAAELIFEYSAATPKLRDIASRMQNSARRMTSIVNQLLDVTRVRLGDGIQLSVAPVDLAALVRGIAEELSAAYRGAQFDVVAEPVHGVWDADRLGQVVSNLAGNAAQYGDVTKPIRLSVVQRDGSAILEVANALRDAPIPTERLATLFDPYRRGDVSAKAHRSGLGLGLFIAQEIVRAHRGRITAASTAAGTVFRVELPLR